MSLQVGDRLGPLEVTAHLGVGGMGEVYRARDTRLGRDVAIKILPEPLSRDPERLARLEQEARALASLSHPNIAVLYGLEEHGGARCLVMELVPGVTLAERIARRPLDWREAIDVSRQLAEALEAAHAGGVIHRDLKPSNVKVTPEGRVKLLDFGLAKAMRGDGSGSGLVTDSPLTGAGAVLGTAAYMSPEQARGQELDKRTDVWSFGCLLYELVTGRRAFDAGTVTDSIVAVLQREPDWSAIPSTTPPALGALIQRCLQKDRSRRLHDIADARIEIEDMLAETGRSTGAGSVAGLSRRVWWSWGLAVTAVAVIVGFLVSAWTRPRTAVGPTISPVPITLAVLPFHVVSGSSTESELGLGLADDIITHLANVGELRVRPTQAVLRYQQESPDLQQAGQALDVNRLLTGTIRRQPAGFRITVQLVRVDDGTPFWGESYDLAPADLPGVGNRITEQVAAALGFRLGDDGRSERERRFTENPAAYEAYLRGRAAMVYGSENGTKGAIAAFEEALRLDSGYALAHAGLSMASAQMHLRFASAAEAPAWRERALGEAARAQALKADLAETHVMLADVYGTTEFEWDRVISESRRALELNPRLALPHAYTARAFYHLGLLERAAEKARLALALAPESPSDAMRTEGITALLSGRFKEAIPPLEEIQRLSGKQLSDYNLGLAYYYSGDTARGESMLQNLADSPSASSSQRARAWLGAFLAARGERARATNLVGQVSAGNYMDHHVAAGLGATYAQLGRPDEALRWLRNAATTGFPCAPWYARDPLLAPLRNNAAFRDWLEELQLNVREADRQYSRY